MMTHEKGEVDEPHHNTKTRGRRRRNQKEEQQQQKVSLSKKKTTRNNRIKPNETRRRDQATFQESISRSSFTNKFQFLLHSFCFAL